MLPLFAIDDGRYMPLVYTESSGQFRLGNAIAKKVTHFSNVILCEFACFYSTPLEWVKSTSLGCINAVCLTCANVKMVWIYTRGIVAMVTNNGVVGDGNTGQDYGNTVSGDRYIVVAGVPIAMPINESSPQPTSGCHVVRNWPALINPRPKSIFEAVGKIVIWIYTAAVIARLEEFRGFWNGLTGKEFDNYLTGMEQLTVVKKERFPASAPRSNPNPTQEYGK